MRRVYLIHALRSVFAVHRIPLYLFGACTAGLSLLVSIRDILVNATAASSARDILSFFISAFLSTELFVQTLLVCAAVSLGAFFLVRGKVISAPLHPTLA